MDMQMDMLGTCPVCHLDLRPGISMNAHLETHPKDMIVNAFLSWMQTGGGGVSNGNNGAATMVAAPVQQSYVRAPMTSTTTIQQTVDYQRQTIVRRDPFHGQQQLQEQNPFGQSEVFYHQHVPAEEEFNPNPNPNQEQIQGEDGQQQHEDNVYVDGDTYFQEDEDGNLILCTSEQALQHQHQQQTAMQKEEYVPVTDYKYVETDHRQVQVDPPEYATAIQEKENRKRLEEQAREQLQRTTANPQQSVREQPKILSVYVLEAGDNIDWPREQEQDEKNRVSPNAVLPCPSKKNVQPTIRTTQQPPLPPPPTVRPVATSVIRTVVTAAKSIKVEPVEEQQQEVVNNNLVNEESPVEKESVPTINLADDEEERVEVKQVKQEEEDDVILITPESNVNVNEQQPPETSNCVQLPPEEPNPPVTPIRPRRELRGNNRAPKILKVTFKKPVHVVDEVGADGEENQLLTSSSQPSEEAANKNKVCKSDVEQTISNEEDDVDDDGHCSGVGDSEAPKSPVPCSSGSCASLGGLIVPKVEREEPVPGPSHYNHNNSSSRNVDPGMLQLKAEDCEEVFISQHSLIKMEDEEEDERHADCDPFGYNAGNDVDVLVALNQSKVEVQLEEENGVEEGGAAPPLKMFMNLKSETVIEELCLSESSSLCSMGGGAGGVGSMERISVNIRAEEAMPAKGEISEQESNADSELLWPSNAIEVRS